MRLSTEARQSLNELLHDHEEDMFMLISEYENHGICYECGNLQSGVEPDAQGYECEECGAHAVGGLDFALLDL